jgi:hypothetical protein
MREALFAKSIFVCDALISKEILMLQALHMWSLNPLHLSAILGYIIIMTNSRW